MERERTMAQAARVSFTRHLLIDGANVAHGWPELRAMMRRERDEARALLVRRVAVLHDEEQMRVTVVFDGRGAELSIERPSGHATLSVLHTASGVTADEVIEQLVAAAAEPANCLVVTADRAERQTVAATGAHVLSPDDLARWIAQVEERQSGRLSDLRRDNEHKWRKR